MVADVSPIVSVLISIWLETLVYGLNISAYLFALYILTKSSVNVVVLILATLLFASATGHIAINLCRLVQGYIQPPSKLAMLDFLYNITVKTNVAKQYMLVMVNLFSDTLLTWRVYMVWEKNWKITMIPAILCAATFTSGIATAINESIVTPGDTVFLKTISHWASSQFSISLAMNLTTTLLIASRIWYMTQDVRKHSPQDMKRYWRVIVIIIESASVAAFWQIIQLAFYESKFTGVYFISDTTVQIVTMAPLLIIILVGLKGSNRSGILATSYPTSKDLTELHFETRVSVGLNPEQSATDDLSGRSTRGDVHGIQEIEKPTSGEFAV